MTHAAGVQSFSCNLPQVLSSKRHLPINPTEGRERRPNADEDRWAARSAWECRSERLKVHPALITRRANQTPTRNKLNRNFLFSPPSPIQTNALLKHYIKVFVYIYIFIYSLPESPVDSSFPVGLNKYLTLEGWKQNKRGRVGCDFVLHLGTMRLKQFLCEAAAASLSLTWR